MCSLWFAFESPANSSAALAILIPVTLGAQLIWLAVLSVPVAAVAWTVTHEEVMREPRNYCIRKSEKARSIWTRKFFYLFTCEFCFSHWVALLFLAITGFKLLYDDWRGYLIAFFSLVWIANVYMGLFGMVRLEVRKERVEIKAIEQEVEQGEEEKKAA